MSEDLIHLQRCPVDARVSDDKQPHRVSASAQRRGSLSAVRHMEHWERFTVTLTQM